MERKYSSTSDTNNSGDDSMKYKSNVVNNNIGNKLPVIIDLLMVDLNEWRSNKSKKMLK